METDTNKEARCSQYSLYSLLAVTYSMLICQTHAPSEIAHTGSRAHKNKVCVHALTSCVCVLTSLPEDDETKYSTG